MKIGIASPIELEMLLDYLYKDDKDRMQNISGLGGTQPTQIAIQFIKMGYTVSIFTLSQDIEPNEYKIFKGNSLTVYVGHFRRGRKVVLDFQFKEILLVKKMIKFDKPDILSCHWTYEFAFAGILSKIPTLITVRDWSPGILKLTKKPYRFMRMLMSFFVYIFGNKFIPNSPYIEEKLKFLKDRRLKIIPNGIDDSLLLDDEKEFHQSSELKLISINNGFGERKNLKPLIKAFNKLLEINSNITLYLIGDGFARNEEAFEWCRENKFSDNITFMGKIEHKKVIALIDECDLMVHPAKEESFGNILVEAMARRVPIIAGQNSGAVPWVIGECGILTNIESSDGIYKSILYFINNPEKLNYYSKKGYNNVYSRFRLSQLALEYLDDFDKVLRK